MPPSVSILIPCYNAEQWIGQAIDSALAQTHPDTEVVVYDDGSTDDSVEVIRQYGDRIHWDTGPNLGGGAARNWLLENAEKEWIQYLDADDYLEPDKVAKQAQAIHNKAVPAETDIIYGPVTLCFENEGGREEILPIEHPNDPWASLVTWDLPQTGSPLWRKCSLLDVHGWKGDQPVCQEHELYLRLLKAGMTFTYHPSGGAVYRQWSEDTVCRKDERRTYEHRIAIMQKAEAFLEETGRMTPSRRSALNNAYLECSRKIWTFAPGWALEIMAHVENKEGGSFSPSPTQTSRAYRWLYSMIGFDVTERVAEWKRAVRHWFS